MGPPPYNKLFWPTIHCDNIFPSAGKISPNLAEKIFDDLVLENIIQMNKNHRKIKLRRMGEQMTYTGQIDYSQKKKDKMFLFLLRRQLYVWAGLAKLASR